MKYRPYLAYWNNECIIFRAVVNEGRLNLAGIDAQIFFQTIPLINWNLLHGDSDNNPNIMCTTLSQVLFVKMSRFHRRAIAFQREQG